jgi:hypothetical protein
MTDQVETTQVEEVETTTELTKVEILLSNMKKCVDFFSSLTNIGGQEGLDALTNLSASIKEVEATLTKE